MLDSEQVLRLLEDQLSDLEQKADSSGSAVRAILPDVEPETATRLVAVILRRASREFPQIALIGIEGLSTIVLSCIGIGRALGKLPEGGSKS